MTETDMSQTAFDEDELFGEAASELKTDVQDALDQAWEALPRAETIETTDGATVSEVLGNLDSKIDHDAVETALQEAKKQYTIGSRADAFDDEFSTSRSILTSRNPSESGRVRDGRQRQLSDSVDGSERSPP